MRTIAVMNNKGGVGKTVTCINLADILVREHGKRVVLVDCDGQRNLTRFFLPDFAYTDEPTVYDVLFDGGHTVWSENLQEIREGLRILPGDSALYSLDVAAVTGAAGGRPKEHMMRALRDIRDCAIEDGDTDYMIFDCPPGFTVASCAALMAAEEVIIPTLMDGFSISGMADLLAQIRSIRSANQSIRIGGILVTQWHNSEVVKQGVTMLKGKHLPVYKQAIRRTDKVPESTFDSSPIVLYSPGSSASQDYRAWAKEIVEQEVQHG